MGIDRAISLFVNGPAQRFPALDQLVVFLSQSDLLKGGVVMGVVWAVWLLAREDQGRIRGALLSALFGSLIALFVARVLAYVTPLRIRPLLDGALHFRAPIGLPAQTNWTSWSSFPSDHAALFFALAWGVWLASKRTGRWLLGYVVVVVCLPRLYIGIHYASDLLAGALLGILFTSLLHTVLFRRLIGRHVLAWEERWPGVFYFLFFLLAYQVATLFWDLRVALSTAGFYV